MVPDGCPGGPVVYLGPAPYDSFQVPCCLPNGLVVKEQVTASTSVAQLKGRLCSETGLPYLCIRLYVGQEELKDTEKLQRYELSGYKQVQVKPTRPLYVGPAA